MGRLFFLFVLFFKPYLSTCFCLLKYSYSFYLILSHLTYKRKQMRMQTESFSLCCKVKYRNWGTHMLIVNGLIEKLHSFKPVFSVLHSFTNSTHACVKCLWYFLYRQFLFLYKHFFFLYICHVIIYFNSFLLLLVTLQSLLYFIKKYSLKIFYPSNKKYIYIYFVIYHPMFNRCV